MWIVKLGEMIRQTDGHVFLIEMPVLKKAKWDANKQLLEKALDFLTGDHWTFSFRDRPYYIEGEANYKRIFGIIENREL